MKTLGIFIISLFTISNIANAQAASETLIHQKNVETVLYIKNKAVASFYDKESVRYFFTINNNKRSLNKKISLLNRASLVSAEGKVKVWVQLDNFYPEFIGEDKEILDMIGLKTKLLSKKGSVAYFGDSSNNSKLLIATKKSGSSYLISEIVIKDKNLAKKVLAIFTVSSTNLSDIKIKFNKISSQSISEIDKSVNLKFVALDEIIKSESYIGSSSEKIKELISKVLLATNTVAEAEGLSIITVSDIERQLIGYQPESYLDLSIKAKASSLEVGSRVTGEYFCGRLLRYDYFVERVDIEMSKC
jgi:hypothetical protein